MKRISWALWAIGLLALPSSASAQTAKPAIIFSEGGVDRFCDALQALDALNPPKAMVDAWNRFKVELAPVDPTQPFRLTLGADLQPQHTLGFLPIDAPAFFKQLRAQNEPRAPKDLGDGIYELPATASQPLAYVTFKGRWAIAGQTLEEVKGAPAEPDKMFEGLTTRYLMSARGDVAQLPSDTRDEWLRIFRDKLEIFAPVGRDESAAAAHREFVAARTAELTKTLDELSTVTVGGAIEAKAHTKLILDLVLGAKPGSDLAKRFSRAREETSRFSGFFLPEAAFAFHVAARLGPADAARNADGVRWLKQWLQSRISASADFDEFQRPLAQQMAAEWFDAATATAKTGEIDAAGSVLLELGKSKIVVGRAVASSTAVERAVHRFFDLAHGELQIELKPAGTHRGVRFETFSISPPPDVALFLGDSCEVCLGYGPESVYLGAGTGTLEMLERLIDTSAADAGKTVPLARAQFALEPILRFFDALTPNAPPNPNLLASLEQFAKSKGLDHVGATLRREGDDMLVRVELEEGVLRSILASYVPAGGQDNPLPAAGIPFGALPGK